MPASDAADGARVFAPHSGRWARLGQAVMWRAGAGDFANFIAEVRGPDPVQLRMRAESIRGERLSAVAAHLVAPADEWHTESIWLRVPPGTDRIWVELVAEEGKHCAVDDLRMLARPAAEYGIELTGVPLLQLDQAEAWLTLVGMLNQDLPASVRRKLLRSLPVVDPAQGGRELLQLIEQPSYANDVQDALDAISQVGEGWVPALRSRVMADAGESPLPIETWVTAMQTLARWQDPSLFGIIRGSSQAGTVRIQPEMLMAWSREFPLEVAYAELLSPALDPSVDPSLQDAALRVLADSRDARFFDALGRLYSTTSPERRLAWLRFCSEFDGAPALDTFAGYVATAPAEQRFAFERAFTRACEAMASYGARQWFLERGLVHREPFLRATSLRMLGPKPEPIEISSILRLARDSDPVVLEEVVALLATARSQQCENALLSLVGHYDPRVAADALRSFWAMRRGDQIARSLARRLVDQAGVWSVQLAALELLAEHAPLGADYLNSLADSHGNWRVRRAAEAALQSQGMPRQVGEAVPLLPEPAEVHVLMMQASQDERARNFGLPGLGARALLQLSDRLGRLGEGETFAIVVAGPSALRFPVEGVADVSQVRQAQLWLQECLKRPGVTSAGDFGRALDRALDVVDADVMHLYLDPSLQLDMLEDWLELPEIFHERNRYHRLPVRCATNLRAEDRLAPLVEALLQP